MAAAWMNLGIVQSDLKKHDVSYPATKLLLVTTAFFIVSRKKLSHGNKAQEEVS